MNYVWRQVKDIWKGGLPVLWRKLRAFAGLLLENKYLVVPTFYSYKLATILNPDSAGARAKLAETLIKLKRFHEAFAAWERAFRLKPNFTNDVGISAGRVGRAFLHKHAHLL
jgi:hypothetical protein